VEYQLTNCRLQYPHWAENGMTLFMMGAKICRWGFPVTVGEDYVREMLLMGVYYPLTYLARLNVRLALSPACL